MGKDDPCSSKTNINSSSKSNTSKGSRKRKMVEQANEKSNGHDSSIPSSLNASSMSKKTKSSSPYPRPTIKYNTPPSRNPIADNVTEKDFEDLQKPKDISVDADSVKQYLQNELMKDKLLPKNKKSRRQYISRQINDVSIDNLKNASIEEDTTAKDDEIVETDAASVNNKEIVVLLQLENPSSSAKKVNRNSVKEKTPLQVSKSQERETPSAMKQMMEVASSSASMPTEIRQSSVMCSPLAEVQNNMERKSRSRDIRTPISNPSDPSCTQNIENNDNTNVTDNCDTSKVNSDALVTVSTTSANGAVSSRDGGISVSHELSENADALRGGVNASAKKTGEKLKHIPFYAQAPTYVSTGEMMVISSTRNKKWTFLSHHDKQRINVNPTTGLLFHPYRFPNKPEPFSKESAQFCFKWADAQKDVTQNELNFWEKHNKGLPAHNYPRKEVDGKPRKAVPVKEYYRRICAGRPRSNSMTTYTEYETHYMKHNRLDKPERKKPAVIPGKVQYFHRRSKSAERIQWSRTQLIVKYMHRKFTVPNLNMEVQEMFSFLRRFKAGTWLVTHSVFWPEYFKIIERKCIEEGKLFVPPTMYAVTPYGYRRLTEQDLAKITPKPSKYNPKPWINSCAEQLVQLFKYPSTPLFSIIKPMHPSLTNHPLIIASARSKLRHIAYEHLTVKQFFLMFVHYYDQKKKKLNEGKPQTKKEAAEEQMLKTIIKVLIQTRLIENRDFGIEGINELFPKQFRARPVSQIPEAHRKFLDTQYSWMIERMIEIEREEEEKRIKEEERLQRLEAREAVAKAAAELAKETENVAKEAGEDVSQELPVVAPTPAKKAPRKRRNCITMGKRKSTGKSKQPRKAKQSPKAKQPNSQPVKKGKRKSDEVDENNGNSAKAAKNQEHEFSPELTASYFSQNETSFRDQSLFIESSAFDNASFDDPVYDQSVMECEKEIAEETSFSNPETSYAVTDIVPENLKIVCDSFVTKAASKKKIFVEAIFKAPKQKERLKHTVPVEEKLKLEAQIVFRSESQTNNFQFKKPYKSQHIADTFVFPDRDESTFNVSEPSNKEVVADIPFVGVGVDEHAPEKVPQDTMKHMEKEKVSLSLHKKSVPDVEMNEQTEEISIIERQGDERLNDMTAGKAFDVNELRGEIMAPRDIGKRSLSVEVLHKSNALKDVRCASVLKDYKISSESDGNALQTITLPSDELEFELQSADKETDKLEQHYQDACLQEASVENMNDISSIIIEKVLISHEEAEQLLAESPSNLDAAILSDNETSKVSDDDITTDLLTETVIDEGISNLMPAKESSENVSVSKAVVCDDNDSEKLIPPESSECQNLPQVDIQEASVEVVDDLSSNEKVLISHEEAAILLADSPILLSDNETSNVSDDDIAKEFLTETVNDEGISNLIPTEETLPVSQAVVCDDIDSRKLIPPESSECQKLPQVNYQEASVEVVNDFSSNINEKVLINQEEVEILSAESSILLKDDESSKISDGDITNEFLTETVIDEEISILIPAKECSKTLPVSKAVVCDDNDSGKLILPESSEYQNFPQVDIQVEAAKIPDDAVMAPAIPESLPAPETDKNEDKVDDESAKIPEKAVKPIEPEVIDFSKLTTPLPVEALMKMSVDNKVEKIPAYTQYISMEDYINGDKSFYIKQSLNQKDLPFFAFKFKDDLVINCGKIGRHKSYSQAVMSGDSCNIYDFVDDEWKCKKELKAKNILLFDKPYGTRRSHIGSKSFPSDDETDYEIVVYKHDFGKWFRSDGRIDVISCYYTLIAEKLVLLFDNRDRYIFDLLWSPFLYYFTFSTLENHVFKDVIIENYNLTFDTEHSPTRLSMKDLDENNIFYRRKQYSKSSDGTRSHGTVTTEKSISGSGGSLSIAEKNGSTSQATSQGTTPDPRRSTSSAMSEQQNINDRKRRHRNYHENIKKIKLSRDNRLFDDNDPNLVLPFDNFKSQTLKYHRRLLVKHNHAYLLKEHQKLILYYAEIFESEIRENSKTNAIRIEKLLDFPRLMIKLGTAMLFTEEKDSFCIESVDEKAENKFRIFMGNIITVSLCDAMRILTSLFVKTTPSMLNKAIIDFHTGERFKSASCHLKYCKAEPDWRFLDNALALSIFEYSKDTSIMTFFFIRHLINAFKYQEFMEQPSKAYIDYYAKVIDLSSPILYAEKILMDVMDKLYDYISNRIDELPKFPPQETADAFIPILRQDSKLSRGITVHRNTFSLKYEYNRSVYNLNTVIPREMFYPKKLNIIPLEIQCHDEEGNDYFIDPIIPRWIFIINNTLIIHPTTYRVLYHTSTFAKVYLFPFDNTEIPLLNKFRHSSGKFNFYGLLKSGIPITVTDICTQPYLHTSREPFDKSKLSGVQDARKWIGNPNLLNDDYGSGLLHSTWKTLSTILMARTQKELLSAHDSNFQTISVDLMRRYYLHKFALKSNLRIWIPDPAQPPRPAFEPVHNPLFKK